MLHKTSGIILHTTKFSESSLIVKVYTKDLGLCSCIINSGRTKRSKNKALFQPLALVEIVITRSGKSELHRITEINSLHPYSSIPYNITKSSIAIFLNEMLYRSIKEAHPDEDMFEYIKNSLLILDLRTESCADFHIYFLVQLSRYLGFYPQGEWSSKTPVFDLQDGRFVDRAPNHSYYLNSSSGELLNGFITGGYDTLHLINTKNERRSLLQALITYYSLHISGLGEIRSHEILGEVIS